MYVSRKASQSIKISWGSNSVLCCTALNLQCAALLLQSHITGSTVRLSVAKLHRMDHLKTSVLAMLFVIFILNKQKFGVITSCLLDKCFGHRKDFLVYRENLSSKCALFFVLGKKKPTWKRHFERSYFVLNGQWPFIILSWIWCFCMKSYKKAHNSSLLGMPYDRI